MSRLDRVEELLNKKKMTFAEIFKKLEKENLVNSNEMGVLYQDLSLDGRFFCTKNNIWDLKKKHKFNQTYIDIEKISLDGEEIFEEEKENLEENEDLDVDSKEEVNNFY